MEKAHDSIQVQAAPVPSPFPVDGANPGPRCGHTLTVIIGADGDLSKAKLVMFGTRTRRPRWHPPCAEACVCWLPSNLQRSCLDPTGRWSQVAQQLWKGLMGALNRRQRQQVSSTSRADDAVRAEG